MAEIVVIGAGVAGLAAAYQARQAGHEVRVFEAGDRWGGLLDHFMVEDFRFEKGAHLSFSLENDKYKELLEKTDYIISRRLPALKNRGATH